jgi:hypothetical protein
MHSSITNSIMKRIFSKKFAWLTVAGSLPLVCTLLGAPVQAQPVTVSGEVVVNSAPPPVVVEAQPESPGPDYIWIPGAWSWNNGWTWEKGHYDRPPATGQIWIAPQYEDRDGRHVYIRGEWREESKKERKLERKLEHEREHEEDRGR